MIFRALSQQPWPNLLLPTVGVAMAQNQDDPNIVMKVHIP